MFDLGLDEQCIDDAVSALLPRTTTDSTSLTVFGSVSTANRPGAGESP